MVGGNVGARILGLVLLALLLAAALNPGGILRWLRAKLVNSP